MDLLNNYLSTACPSSTPIKIFLLNEYMYYIFQILSKIVGNGNLIATPSQMKSER
jgi:hypothetical protein